MTDRLPELHKEFDDEITTDERRTEIVQEVQEIAKEDGYRRTCVFCRQLVVYLPYDHALAKGHVYSEAGVQEVDITGVCEWCFDDVTKEPEDD